ncbi:MAG: hypothetical protein NTX79_07365 [Candidatus Micrarchaeota archaeon]|nr:hypothetical protein [Candidatus Micrarchaeota archaeon]
MSAKMIRKERLEEAAKPEKGAFKLPEARKPAGKRAKIAELKAKLSEMVGYCYRPDDFTYKNPYEKVPIATEYMDQYTCHSTLNRLVKAQNTIAVYLGNRGESPEMVDMALEQISILRDFYNSLPYETMIGKEEFYPLFTARALLERLGEYVERNAPYWKESRENAQEDVKTVQATVLAIREVLFIYDNGVIKVASELNSNAVGGFIHIPIRKQKGGQYLLEPLENGVEALKAELSLLARYYFKGMAIRGMSIHNKCDAAFIKPELKDEKREEAYEVLEAIKGKYNSIPFGSLHDNPSYYHLFTAKKVIEQIENELGVFFSLEKPSQDDVKRVGVATRTLEEIGFVYECRMTDIYQKIRSTPGNEKYTIAVNMMDGRVWYNWIPFC